MKRFTGILFFVLMSVLVSAVPGVQKKKKGTPVPDSLLAVEQFRIAVVPPASGVQFYREGIIFLENFRSEESLPENHLSFGRVGTCYAILSDTSLGMHTAFSPSFLYDVPCEGMTFNADYSSMYYSKLASKKEPEKIFHARYQQTRNGKIEWISDASPLPFCTGSSAYLHPSLSPDGSRMVFASNMTGSLGGFDLFVSTSSGDGWSVPENLGKIINTDRNEMFPFIDQDNNLYFSSDGHQGLGGYDIFICRSNGNGWDDPVNLTGRINSPDDEIAFTMSRADRKTAFYTKRLRSAASQLKLYRVSLPSQISPQKFTTLTAALEYISGVVKPVKEASTAAPVTASLIPQPDQLKPVSEERAPAEVKPKTGQTVNQNAPVAEKPGQPATAKADTKAVPAATAAVDVVVYRVQFATASSPRGSYEVTFAGRKYKTFEYRFSGAFRECAGEFQNLAQAAAFQKIVMKNGYPDAFVVAFRNNIRSNDPKLFGK